MTTLTRDDILAMEAGPDMDALVATHVMRLPRELIHHKPEGKLIAWRDQPEILVACCDRYSTDIAAAWEVVRKVHSSGWTYMELLSKRGGEAVHVSFERLDTDNAAFFENAYDINGSAPLAICRAALLTTINDKDNAP